MLDGLATGGWLTTDRRRVLPALMLAMTIVALAALFATAHGTLDRLGRPLGTDFSDVWSAGVMACTGRAAEAWDWTAQHAVQQAIHHTADVPFYGWHYPPPFLLVAAALSRLPYVAALLVWQGVTLAAALLVVRRIMPEAVFTAVAAPVVLVCVGHGQNGFLTATLLGGGLLLLGRRSLVAGLLLGCLVYKPQFGLMLPVLLLALGDRRAIAGAALSALALVAMTLLLWGWPVWAAFLHSLPLTRAVVVEQGATGWEKIQSPFAALRALGAPLSLAYGGQALATLAALAGTAWAARTASAPVRNAIVCAGTLMATPYVLDYDLTLLGLAAVFLAADGRARAVLPWEKSALAFAWIVPLFARQVAALTFVPLGLVAIVAIFVLALRRAMVLDGAAPPRSSPCRRSHGWSAP